MRRAESPKLLSGGDDSLPGFVFKPGIPCNEPNPLPLVEGHKLSGLKQKDKLDRFLLHVSLVPKKLAGSGERNRPNSWTPSEVLKQGSLPGVKRKADRPGVPLRRHFCERPQRTNEAVAGRRACLVEEDTQRVSLRHRDIFLPTPLWKGQMPACKRLPIRFNERLPVACGDERLVARVRAFCKRGRTVPAEVRGRADRQAVPSRHRRYLGPGNA